MRYIFELCPECRDKLVERNIDDFQEYHESICPNCGSTMHGVLFGKKRAEDAIYKITLNKLRDISKHGDRCFDIIRSISGLDKEAVIEKTGFGDCAIFEGDLLNTYLVLRELDKIEYMINYHVTPEFPYAREFSMMCSNCGEEAEYRVVYGKDDDVTGGFFCERCNEWVMYTGFCRADVDETEYCIEISAEGIEDDVREKILYNIGLLWERKIEGDSIKARGQSVEIRDTLTMLEAYNIPYIVTPLYPYEIPDMSSIYKHE